MRHLLEKCKSLRRGTPEKAAARSLPMLNGDKKRALEKPMGYSNRLPMTLLHHTEPSSFEYSLHLIFPCKRASTIVLAQNYIRFLFRSLTMY